MDREFALKLLTEKQSLLKRILEFNHLLDDPISLRSLKGTSFYENLKQKPQYLRLLRRESLNLFNFEKIENRFCLLDATQLNKLSILLGCAIYSKKILQMVKASSLKNIKEDLGYEFYSFATGRGQFYLNREIASLFLKDENITFNNVKQSGLDVIFHIYQNIDAELKPYFKIENLDKLSVVSQISLEQYQILLFSVIKMLRLEVCKSCQEIFL